MIYKRCAMCGKRLPSGTQCGCRKREYREPEGIYKLYHTQRWQKAREAVIAKFNGIDQWALYHGRIECAETVHHIIPTTDDGALFFSQGNLIPVSRASHDEIHALYRADKTATQRKLREITEGQGVSEKLQEAPPDRRPSFPHTKF